MTHEVDGKTKGEFLDRVWAADLPAQVKVLARVMANAHGKLSVCLSVTTMAERTAMSDRAIYRALRQGEDAGLWTTRSGGYNRPAIRDIDWQWGADTSLPGTADKPTSMTETADEYDDSQTATNGTPSLPQVAVPACHNRQTIFSNISSSNELPRSARARVRKELACKKEGREGDGISEGDFDDLIADLSAAGQYAATWGWGADCRDEVDAIRRASGDKRAFARLKAMKESGMHGRLLQEKLSEAASEAAQ